MWPEAGHMALIMAAWVALLQAVLPLWGSLSARRAGWQALARPLAVLQLALIVLAFGALWPSSGHIVSSFCDCAPHRTTPAPIRALLASSSAC